MRRVAVVGSSGAGESALARTIAKSIGVPVVDLETLLNGSGPDLTSTPEFRSKVITAIADAEGDASTGGWVAAGNHRTVSDIVQRRADTIVWIDLPRITAAARLVKRSLRSSLTRRRTQDGEPERLRDLLARRADENVLLWSWQHHHRYARIYDSYASGAFWSHATVHRLRTRREVDSFAERFTT